MFAVLSFQLFCILNIFIIKNSVLIASLTRWFLNIQPKPKTDIFITQIIINFLFSKVRSSAKALTKPNSNLQ